MGKWNLFLLIGMLASCASREIRCDGHLTAINPPVAREAAQPQSSRDAR
jgi:hypothetical protein